MRTKKVIGIVPGPERLVSLSLLPHSFSFGDMSKVGSSPAHRSFALLFL